MESIARPFLCFEEAYPEYRQLALDYWSGGMVDGRFKWDASVEDISELHGVLKKDVPKLVRLAATAVNPAIRCCDCDYPQELSSRSAFTARVYGDHLCTSCLQARNRARQDKQKQEEERRFAALREVIANASQRNQTFCYDDIEYTDAVIAFGIMLASDEACEDGRFQQSDALHLCTTTTLSGKLLGRLFNRGILGMEDTTPPRAIELVKEGGWSYFPHRIHWKFARDTNGRSFPSVMTLLGEIIDAREDDPEYGQAVAELWRMLAYDDALDHLVQEVDSYRLPDVRVGPKTDEAVWHALEHFSIPQVRREITNVVKNAAALSQRRDYVKRHALNTIPGTLISYVDRAVSEGWQVSPVLHNWQNEEPILLTVLFNRVLGTGLPGFKTLSNSLLKTSVLGGDAAFE